MRLTLRTLLAYLDNTLEPEDAEALRLKLEESGFATQLVQRIRDSLANKELTAPPPDSAHPIGEVNVVSEYLDSTLTAEQISEFERACLESEPHLAEAAACHQILTMVLGKPAEVSDALRRRIYLLPESHEPKPRAAGSFSSVSIPPDDSKGAMAEEVSTSATTLVPAGEAVQPVGLVDSGVFDAPTRIRDSDTVADQDGGSISGSHAHLQVSDVYDGTVRTSRITPWLVSLALAGVLLFVLAQIFAPLLSKTTAQNDSPQERIKLNPDLPADTEIEAPAEQTPPLEPVGTPAVSTEPAPDKQAAKPSGEEMLPPPSAKAPAESPADAVEETPSTAVDAIGADASAAEKNASEQSDIPANATVVKPLPVPLVEPAPDLETAQPEVPMVAKSPADSSDAVPPAKMEQNPGTTANSEDEPSNDQDLIPRPADAAVAAVQPPAVPPADLPEKPVVGLAKLTSDATLLMGLTAPDQWEQIAKDQPLGEGVLFVNAPGYYTNLVTPEGDVITLIGATSIQLVSDPDGGQTPGISLGFGRALITAKRPGVTIAVNLGDRPAIITLAEPETILGVEVQYFREPGKDPRDEANRTRVARLFSVQGDIQFQTGPISQKLTTGQQWLMKGEEVAPVAAMPAMPAWVKAPDPDVRTLESGARNTLLELLGADQPLMLTLLEATAFRQSEVGALAAQSLLLLGNASVYFGGDGILSNPKQRAFWTEHYRAIQAFANRSAESADALATAITEMDAADGKTLFRLVIGYSPKQLLEGGDEELVNMLESSSMAVRVLATETLREITGTTLYFRPDEENAVRRAQGIKKWRTRQRKGDIKWGGMAEE